MKRIAYLLFILLFFCKPLFAQNFLSNLSITKLSPDDGLSQGSNYFRFEDSKGFMWITANDAINRYDGSRVKVYNLDRYFKNCPNLQQGYGFAEDKESNIYIGSVRGLYIHHSNTDKFTLQKIFAKGDEVAMPFAYHDGKIWCFNKSYEIATYDPILKRVAFIGKVPITPLSSIHVYDLPDNTFYYRWPFIDADNNIWFIGQNKIVTLNSKTYVINEIDACTSKQIKPVYFCSAYDYNTNSLMIGTNNGFVIYNIKTGAKKHIISLAGLVLGRVESIANSSDMIVLRNPYGMLITDKNLSNGWWVKGLPTKIFRYFQFSFDKSGRLWMCDDGLGQIIYDFSVPLLPKVPGNVSKFNVLEQSGVGNFAEFSNGDILVENTRLLKDNTKQFQLYNYPSSVRLPLNFRPETAIKQNGIWLPEVNYTNKKLNIYFLNKNREIALKYSVSESEGLGIFQNLSVLANNLKIAAFSNGIYILKEKSIEHVKNQPAKNPFFINKISNNKCAISYLNNDMWLVDFNDTSNIKFIKKILPGIQSFYLQEDTINNQYWVGTNKGIYLLDKNFNVLKLFDANNGLAGTYIYGLLLDNENNVWCSHQRGLSSINAKTFDIINYDKTDGIQDWDFNNRSFYKATDGTLYFGGVSGFNFFKPPLHSSSYYKPEIYIDDILVNNKILLPDTNANNLKEINLSYTENNISIIAILKNLKNAKKDQAIYRIRENGTKWNTISNQSINFNSLSPGKYTLELGYFDKFTHQAIVQKKLIISIALPFFKTKWFGALIAIAITAFVFWLFNKRRLARQKILFEQQIALEHQRSKITADLHDDIGASLSSLQLNSAIANQLIHKDTKQTQQLLGKIESQAKNLADKIGDIIWSMKPGKEEFLTMSSRIKNFANDIFSATEIAYKITTDPEIDYSIKDIIVRKNIVFIAKEAINNVAKYSKGTKVMVSILLVEHNIELTISDNGIGFDPETTTGNGLANMRKRTEELNGIFKLTTHKEKGTTILAIIPHIP